MNLYIMMKYLFYDIIAYNFSLKRYLAIKYWHIGAMMQTMATKINEVQKSIVKPKNT